MQTAKESEDLHEQRGHTKRVCATVVLLIPLKRSDASTKKTDAKRRASPAFRSMEVESKQKK